MIWGRCACKSHDAERCLALRIPRYLRPSPLTLLAAKDDEPELCECSCHDNYEMEDAD